MGNAVGYAGNLLKRWVGKDVQYDIRSRHFAFRLMLYDGISGKPLFDKTYAGEGIWDAKFTEVTGFGTPRFWKTTYGQAVNALIGDAVNDLGQKINCQPFMVRSKVHSPDKAVYLLAGANNGVNVGDTFEIYAQGEALFSGMGSYSGVRSIPPAYKRLQKIEGSLTITETYPSYSIGKFSAPLSPDRPFLAISW